MTSLFWFICSGNCLLLRTLSLVVNFSLTRRSTAGVIVKKGKWLTLTLTTR